MGDGFACCFPSSPSTKFVLIMVPLILVSGLFCVLGPKDYYKLPPPVHNLSSPSSPPPPPPPSSSSPSGEVRTAVTDRGLKIVTVENIRRDDAVSDEAVSERSSSSSPALSVEVESTLPADSALNKTLDGNSTSLDLIGSSPSVISGLVSANNSITDESTARLLKKGVLSNLEKIEAKLQRARAAIKEASNGDQLEDPDYVPIGPMYWDAKAFHRSYLEMEKRFKIYVYREGEPPLFHDGPCKSIYSMEGNFIYEMETQNPFRTEDPDRAHVFYLPFSVVKMVRFVYERDSRDFGPIRSTVQDYINLVAEKYPYWNRSLGADHFILSCHDWGPEASFSNPYLGRNSIRALCNANTSERFNPTKDVSIPEINLLTGKLTGLIGGPSPSQRPILAFFAGGVHGPIRPILLDHWEDKDKDVVVHKYLPKGVSYNDMMRKSRFCLCPSGYEVASPRVVEAIYSGCVPVLINVNYTPPFSDVLNWKSFSVRVSVSDIPNLKNILMNISSRQYIRMQRRVLNVRRHFEFNSPPKRFDVFHMILHSVWLRRLNVQIREL